MVEMASRIKPLDVSVINKIAAGEIVIAPVNALKEMMENSIDAKATMIDVLVKEGGIKLLQITDNGSGINKEDLPILCERFTTSKLAIFEDLSKIETFGFRGEALASISHIARVTVTTKTEKDECAWKASFSEGKMLGDPKPVAGKTGTIITVEDLFYNIPSRLKALRSPADEFNKILDVIGRYSINNDNVGFSCKKFGDSKVALMIKSDLSKKDRVRIIFGAHVSTKLMELHIDVTNDVEKNGLLSASGLITNLDFTNKKPIQPAFFINGRLVSCDPMRRSFNQIYSTFLPKGNKSFMYLALTIRPQNVDVNIHPTKREVRFLHEEEIIDALAFQLQEKLASIDTSRTFKTASFAATPYHAPISNHETPDTAKTNQKVKRQENKLVRIDSSQAKITNYMRSAKLEFLPPHNNAHKSSALTTTDDSNTTLHNNEQDLEPGSGTLYGEEASTHQTTSRNNTYFIVPKKKRLASIQCDLKLFLVDYGSICNELFYQIGLSDFSNFGRIMLYDQDDNEPGFNLKKVLENIDTLREEKIQQIIEKIANMKEMLNEYFCLEVETNEGGWSETRIKCVPLLLKDYNPPLSKLPFFIYRVGTQVNWDDEMECIDGILRQLALFYIPPIIQKVDGTDSEYLNARYASEMNELTDTMDHVIFPTIKKRLLAPKTLLKDVVEVANLPGLYKVFERC
ncbi:unnamed protein product [Kluyveromyces dobzhanskii CBS 2104]|uniref:WGS project CCBQ000000000 data, contig 00102 n=1 Tax=Kluyveromyces dobzhanskii CBS 2104 TaxID=1427455 RepID=A0A0A8L3U9_9SACH|nr:unnamed protein product [Kluyveromyces dobzhanskii CBS 2104]